MKWITALGLWRAILGGILPTVIDSQSAIVDGIAGRAGEPSGRNAGGFLFSIPLFLLTAVGARMFFNWHSR